MNKKNIKGNIKKKRTQNIHGDTQTNSYNDNTKPQSKGKQKVNTLNNESNTYIHNKELCKLNNKNYNKFAHVEKKEQKCYSENMYTHNNIYDDHLNSYDHMDDSSISSGSYLYEDYIKNVSLRQQENKSLNIRVKDNSKDRYMDNQNVLDLLHVNNDINNNNIISNINNNINGNDYNCCHKKNSLNYYNFLHTDKLLSSYNKMYHYIKKNLKKKKKIHTYSILIFFKTQIYADMFYKKFHCRNLSSFMCRNVSQKNVKNFYDNWYIYCAFVNLIYYILNYKENIENVGTNQSTRGYILNKNVSSGMSSDTYDDISDDIYDDISDDIYDDISDDIYDDIYDDISNNLRDNVGIPCAEKEMPSKYLNTSNRKINMKDHIYSSQLFNINKYEKFIKSIIIDTKICISTCLLCMELLDNDIFLLLTRNEKICINKKRNNNYYEYINLSCNVCTLIFFYDISSKLFNSDFCDILKTKNLNQQQFVGYLENLIFLSKDNMLVGQNENNDKTNGGDKTNRGDKTNQYIPKQKRRCYIKSVILK
ncbi:hypothetical protein PFMALIP_01838 [Plasmodium falciparum MaliPS096_E11]|uniref:Uncharacterized protein n=1 Tax=Plasmodium falciparum MaliPS096_E11 TaxID=1036727 RepID=A0A024WTU0_PLAFA|nr:hypothetical protein PFMALIP_01838 [Plasmodium falciparum MaliPS096_E11]